MAGPSPATHFILSRRWLREPQPSCYINAMTSRTSAIMLYQSDDFENLSHRVILHTLGEWEERFWNLNKQKTLQNCTALKVFKGKCYIWLISRPARRKYNPGD